MVKRPIFYDTETTGIRPEKDFIIEIAAFDAFHQTKFESLINPSIPIPKEASKIHNITDDMVKKAPLFKEVGLQFLDFCKGDVVLIAHNNDAFDRPFIESEFKRHALPMPNYAYIDSLKFSRKYRPDLPRHSLQHLRDYYGIPANQAHRALDDVIILEKIFSEMIDDLSVQTILDLMSQKQLLRHMPFGKHQGKPLKEVPRNYIQWLNDNGAFNKAENKELKEALTALNLL